MKKDWEWRDAGTTHEQNARSMGLNYLLKIKYHKSLTEPAIINKMYKYIIKFTRVCKTQILKVGFLFKLWKYISKTILICN